MTAVDGGERAYGRSVTAVILGVVAAWYFHGSVDYFLGWTDEGQIVYPSWQVAEGAVPYVSFHHLYGPSVFFLNGALLRLFGADLRVIRLFLVAVKVGVVVLVFALSRRVARPAIALTVSGLLVLVWGAPGWFFNAPYASYYATALCLAGLLAFRAGRGIVHPLASGMLLGAATTFKQTQGVFAVVSVLLFLVLGTEPQPGGRVARAARVVIPLGAAMLALAYVRPQLPSVTAVVVVAPLLVGAALASRARRADAPRGMAEIVLVVTGAALPLLAYAGLYAWIGGLKPLLADTMVDLPARVRWFTPAPVPAARSVLLAVAAAASLVAAALRPGWRRRGALAVLAVAIAGLLAFATAEKGLGAYVAGGVALDDFLPFVGWLPFAVLAATAGLALGRPNDGTPALLWLFTAGAVLQFYPAADIAHAVLLLPASLPLLAFGLEHLVAVHRETVTPRAASARLLLALAWPLAIGLPFLRNRLTLSSPATMQGGFARATGILDVPPKSGDAAALVRHLARQASPDGGALILCNEQLLYFLAGIRSPLPREEFALYLVGADLTSAADARRLVSEDAIIRILDASRPLIVDCPRLRAGARFRTAFPAVARFIDTHYDDTAAFGGYRVLAFDVGADAPSRH